MIFTQIAAFVVLVAVPVGAALYCAYAFFQKRKRTEWAWRSLVDLYVIAALVIIYSSILFHMAYIFMFASAGATYLGVRLLTVLRDQKEMETHTLKRFYITIAGVMTVILIWGAILFHEPSLFLLRHVMRYEFLLMVGLPAFLSWFSIRISKQRTKNHKLFFSLSLIAGLAACYGLYVHHDIFYKFDTFIFKKVVKSFFPLGLVFLPFILLIMSLLGLFKLEIEKLERPYLPRFLAMLGLFFVAVFFAFVMYLCFLEQGIADKVTFFLFLFVIPPAITLWINRAYFWKDNVERAKRRSSADYFLIGLFVMGLASYMTVRFNYYPMFLKEYRCVVYNGGDVKITTGYRITSSAPNVFQRIFRNNDQRKGLCFCPEGRTHMKSYEESKLCLSETEARKNWQDKTENSGD
ncbi:MAG: hypothetical protein HND56_10510 [Pseudomonadota bacterium]|nr:hypothetical protein [Pseudomonadota bacterium]QKK06092.1 MAG: hypothetical protein HND56_10510 [Pseudomonadota bacterium]